VHGIKICKDGLYWGEPGVDRRIISVLRLIFRKCDVGLWTGLSWLRTVKVGGHL
jgi:hypothetical protein